MTDPFILTFYIITASCSDQWIIREPIWPLVVILYDIEVLHPDQAFQLQLNW